MNFEAWTRRVPHERRTGDELLWVCKWICFLLSPPGRVATQQTSSSSDRSCQKTAIAYIQYFDHSFVFFSSSRVGIWTYCSNFCPPNQIKGLLKISRLNQPIRIYIRESSDRCPFQHHAVQFRVIPPQLLSGMSQMVWVWRLRHFLEDPHWAGAICHATRVHDPNVAAAR